MTVESGVWRLRGRITDRDGQTLDLDADCDVQIGREGDPTVAEITRVVRGEVITDELRHPATSRTRFATGLQPYAADHTVRTEEMEAIASPSELDNKSTGP